MITKTVKAKKVREGDFLTGLDDGYVYTEPTPIEGEKAVTISFHDAHGNEGSVECWSGMPISVRRSA